MTATVIDSSIALQWVLPESGAEDALRYVKSADVIAPDILLVEAANVLAKKVRAHDLEAGEALKALAMIRSALAGLVRSELLVSRALNLSIALSHPVYDGVFLACAEHVRRRLVTRDAPLIKRATERGFGHLFAESMS